MGKTLSGIRGVLAVSVPLALFGIVPAFGEEKCAIEAPEIVASNGVLDVGVNLSAPPQTFANENNQPDGFDVDIAKAVAKELCLDVAFVNQAFAGLLPSLSSGKLDVVISRVQITEEREKSFDFVPYFKSGLYFMAKAGAGVKIESEADICGRKIGIVTGSVQEKDLVRINETCPADKKIEPITYPDNTEIIQQLRKGTVDVVYTVWTVLAYAVKLYPQNFELVSKILSGRGWDVERPSEGIVVRKGEGDTLAAVQKAVEKIRQDGTYAELLKKWGLQGGGI